MSIYLKILAVFYGYGALIHIADLLSVGHYLGQTHGFTFARMPVAWKIATVYFAILDTITAIGLWRGAWWGVVCFLLAAGSQIVMYTALAEIFTKQIGLVVFHLVTVGLYVLLRFWGKMTVNKAPSCCVVSQPESLQYVLRTRREFPPHDGERMFLPFWMFFSHTTI